jgi:hypothetical protein
LRFLQHRGTCEYAENRTLAAWIRMRPVPRQSIGAVMLAAVLASGCSIKTLAVKTVANTLAEPGDTFTRDDDPELVRAALPFGLKTFESLLESVPTHKPLLIATCSGFTSYAYAFVQTDADLLPAEAYDQATRPRRWVGPPGTTFRCSTGRRHRSAPRSPSTRAAPTCSSISPSSG